MLLNHSPQDNLSQPVQIESLVHICSIACRGILGADARRLAAVILERGIGGLNWERGQALAIECAVALAEAEPAYSFVAARILSEAIRAEVGTSRTLEDYLTDLRTLGIIPGQEPLSPLAEEMEFMLCHEMDGSYGYSVLDRIYKHELLRDPRDGRCMERPQWFVLRRALASLPEDLRLSPHENLHAWVQAYRRFSMDPSLIEPQKAEADLASTMPSAEGLAPSETPTSFRWL